MAAIKFHKFHTIFEAEMKMGGGIRFPLSYKGNEVILGLHGLTLVFTAPSTTITFADASGVGLTIMEAIGQIETDSSNALKGLLRDGVLHIIQPTPTAAVNLNKAGSTAPTKFGMVASGTLVGKFFNPPGGAAPRVLAFQPSPQSDSLMLMTEE